MELNIAEELTALRRLAINELRDRYAELFGETTNNRHRTWLIKRIIWRMQAHAEGDLSERAKQRAIELARDADLRVTLPKPKRARVVPVPAPVRPSYESDPRLPPPGSLLVRPYKGQALQVEVLQQGFGYAGKTYPSLSAVAKAITGSHCNGFHFFRLTGGKS